MTLQQMREILSRIIITIMVGPPHDKCMHAITGCVLGLLSGILLGTKIAVGLVIAAALGKEAYDAVSNRFFNGQHEVSALDALASVIGGGIGILAAIGISVT